MGESRPQARDAERSGPRIGVRVGALAVFLGVALPFTVPGIAHAETEGSSSSSSESSGEQTAATPGRSQVAKAKSWLSRKKVADSAAVDATGSVRAGSAPADRDRRVDLPRLTKKALLGRRVDRVAAAADPGPHPRFPRLRDRPDPAARSEARAPWRKVQPSPAAVGEPRVAVIQEPTQVVSKIVTALTPRDPAPSTPEPAPVPAKAPLAEVVTDVLSAVFAPRAGVAVDRDVPGQSPAGWVLLAFARRQVGSDAALEAPEVTTTPPAPTLLVNQVSPLGTPWQLAAEKTAMRTVDTVPVKLMKLVLRLQFQSAVQQEFAAVGGVDAENMALLDTAVDQFALFSAFTQQLINPMDPAIFWADTPPHNWFGVTVGDSRYLYDNPDTIYRFVGVNKNASYVITGRFHDYDPDDRAGTLPADTSFSVVEGTSGETSSLLTTDQLEIAPDGSFVITVSGAPAAPGQRNHIQLTSRSTVLLARNTLGDWNTEEPMTLSIAKVGGPPDSLFAQLGGFTFLGGQINDNKLLVSLVSLIPPLAIAETPLVRGTLTAIIMVVRGGNEQAKYIALATTDPVTGAPKPANVIPQPTSNAEFLANQRQSIGNFQLADDEALVLTIDPGSAGYFTVPVYSVWTTTTDFWSQQTSLNNKQSQMNPDGTYTVVISPADPGVYNWVSTGGLNQGIIAARFQDIDETNPDGPRVVSYQVVPIGEVAQFYPDDPRYFVDAQQRAEQLELRKAGYNTRFLPYPQV
ncbi:DUF1214 domain-containing protein [[Mycobacterium] burgundiense]|uniref:DUF1214 domain-containing protein n=1 Tax=[Mycobacterium] burgundiense TaxID=3064286 RepID=A0ABM9LS21_9MYCO|nr:DUF1214 domain-containing protein [Mycolicibacterium sp. MU0053]CAJ1503788.1 DUF1214 domain-containing protein [Mycolicibacterium sp. MU0053]